MRLANDRNSILIHTAHKLKDLFLSRRNEEKVFMFLEHDPNELSKSLNPLSWNRDSSAECEEIVFCREVEMLWRSLVLNTDVIDQLNYPFYDSFKLLRT